jgi:hypothetical protein
MTISHISKKAIPIGESVKFTEIREGIQDLINSSFPDFGPNS